MSQSTFERYWPRVAWAGPEECWSWTGWIDGGGYGTMRVGGRTGRTVSVHRIAYELSNGPIPEGLEIDHLCRNRACCNPAHLEAVTHAENNRRSDSPSAVAARVTHCPKGHPYDEANTHRYRKPHGGWGRQCRRCNNERRNRYR